MADEAPVIIVGAGPVGMAAAVLLARDGVSTILLERRGERSVHPKARGLRLRASELVALWGFDAELRAIAMPAETQRFIYTESLVGEELARTAPPSTPQQGWSSVPIYRVPQDRLEAVLEQRVAATPSIRLVRGTTATAAAETIDGVIVSATGADGSPVDYRGRYVIAADGVGSRTRAALGIAFGSDGAKPYWQSVYFRGDLRQWTAERLAIMYYTRAGENGTLVGIGPADAHDRWVLFAQNPPSLERPAPLSAEDATVLIRRAVGSDDFAPEIVSSATFRISADVAETYRAGRVFLAGDAAHSLPPTGGFGMNTGFADVHNLAWKLARVLRGAAPERLLESYDSERRPVAASNAAWSSGNAKRMVAIRAALAADDRDELRQLLDAQTDHIDPVMQDLGFSYRGVPDRAKPYAVPVVGARAPHARHRDGSILDAFEGRFTLVIGASSGAWADAAAEIPELSSVVIDDVRYPVGSGALLVRPDGHVGWIGASETDASRLRDAYAAVIRDGLAD